MASKDSASNAEKPVENKSGLATDTTAGKDKSRKKLLSGLMKTPAKTDNSAPGAEPELIKIAPARDKTSGDGNAKPSSQEKDAAANQNMPNSGAIMRDINRRPSSAIYIFALIISLAWLGLGAAYIWGYYGSRIVEEESFRLLLTTPGAITMLTAFVLPVPLIWMMALMLRRSQEMHMMANAMARTAIQLTVPEGLAGEAISSIGQAIRREVAAMNEGVERALGRASELEALVHSEVTALERAYSDSETRMRAMLESLYQERQSISSAGHSLGNELEPTIARLKEEGSSLHMLIEGATKNLHALDKRLTQHANGLNEASNLVSVKTGETLAKMTDQANEMKSLAGGVLKDIKTTASQFSEQAEGLNSAVESLKSANHDIDDVLKERHDKLSSLAEMLVRKSEDIDQLMGSYATIINDALTSAERRAGEIGKQMAYSATQSTRAAISEIENLRDKAGQETTRAISSFRKNYEQVNQDLGHSLDEAGNRFSSTTNELRRSVNQMSNELEKTRSDLEAAISNISSEMEKAREEISQAIVKLPEETTRNTAALRQAVMDEIGALDALNQMVQGKSGIDDTYQPPERSRENLVKSRLPIKTAATPKINEKPVRSEGFKRKFTSSMPGEDTQRSSSKWSLPELLAAASKPEDDAESLAPIGLPRTSINKHEVSPPPVHDNLPPLQEAMHISEPPVMEDTMQPQYEFESPPEQSPATLNSLSVDLSRALDHQAPAELWRRYRDGEAGVFTRRLYTPRGQRIFDEIAHKYQKEREFSSDVDRYIRDFENLLDSATDSDRESMLVDTYLTSETGKVYLMLAHASGRLSDD